MLHGTPLFLFNLFQLLGAKSLFLAIAHNHLNGSPLKRSLTVLLSFLFLWFFISIGHAQTTVPASTHDTSYNALADLLEDPHTREQLVGQLRSLAVESSNEPAVAARSEPLPTERVEPVRAGPLSRISDELQVFAVNLQSDMAETWGILQAFITGRPLPSVSVEQWQSVGVSLAVVVVSLLLANFLLRLCASYLFRRLNVWALQTSSQPFQSEMPKTSPVRLKHSKVDLNLDTLGLGRKLIAVTLAFVVDIAATLLSALVAYVAVIAFTPKSMSVSLFAMKLLTAFVLVESVKAISRGVFSTRYEQLRLFPLSTASASYWNRWLIVLITITGYSLLVIVPVTQVLVSEGTGRLVGLMLMMMVYVYAVRIVWKNRQHVSAGLLNYAQQTSIALMGTLLRVLARLWHWAALGYLTVLFVVSQADQKNALGFMAHATVQSLASVLIGLFLAAILSSMSHRHIRLSEHWRTALPLLETRINAYVPAFLKSLRLLILLLVSLIVLDAWHVFDLIGWVGSTQGKAAINTLFHVGVILLIAALSWTVLASIIEHRVSVSSGSNKPTEREKTLLLLFRSAAALIISTLTVLVVLSQIGINIGPLIAGAGVAGLAIGFGAQKLVQDVITGIFIQLENGMNQNDIVEVVGLFGTVEKITIRSVVIRTLDGGYHLIPFSTIDKLTNHTRDYGYHYGEYHIAYRESVDQAIAQLELAFEELKQDPELAPEIMEEISIPGVTSFNERGFTIRVLIKTTPGMQWAVQRGFNRLVKKYFDAAGIELPYPQTVLHFGKDTGVQAESLDASMVDTFKQMVEPAASADSKPAT